MYQLRRHRKERLGSRTSSLSLDDESAIQYARQFVEHVIVFFRLVVRHQRPSFLPTPQLRHTRRISATTEETRDSVSSKVLWLNRLRLLNAKVSLQPLRYVLKQDSHI
jgi:hypothetical protein